jgi:hypothetical protein
MKEIAEFDRRYWEALGPSVGSPEQMAAALAMYPAMKEMMGKFQAENVKMDGTPVLTETTMETVRTQEQMAQESKQRDEPSDASPVRGLGGLIGRKLAGKKDDQGGPKNRGTVFTMNHELLKASPAVAESDLAVPSSFKEKK